MAYNQKAKFKANSPLPCWKGYERVPGTKKGAPGSCRKSSPTKHGSLEDFQRGRNGHNPDTMSAKHEDFHLKQSKSSPNKTMGYEVKIEKGKVVSEKERPHNDFKPGREGESQHEAYHNRFPEKPFKDAEGRPLKQQKGGGTKKVCLPKAKIDRMSSSERSKVTSAKRTAAAKGDYRRSGKSNVSGARKKGATLRDWFKKEDWRQVGDPSKKCGEN